MPRAIWWFQGGGVSSVLYERGTPADVNHGGDTGVHPSELPPAGPAHTSPISRAQYHLQGYLAHKKTFSPRTLP